MLNARLVPLHDGPYELTGPIEIAGREGQSVLSPAEKIYLCRCGRSATKPFCDGSHARTGWKEEK